MKKPFIVLLALLTIFLCACSPSTPPVTSQPRQTAPATSALPAPTLPASTQGTTEEITYRNDYFAQLLSHYHPSFQKLNYFLILNFEAFESNWNSGKTEGSLLNVLECLGEPWLVTEKEEQIILHYIPNAHLTESFALQDEDIPNWFFIMEKNGDTLSLKEIKKTEERILLPSAEKTVTPQTSPQRNDLLSHLIEAYCPTFDGNKAVGHAWYNYLRLWKNNFVNGTFGEVVDQFGPPWHTWEQDGAIHMEYRFKDTPSFTFLFRPAEDNLLLEEIRTLYVERDDLTPEMLAQLKVGESTKKEVGTLLGAPKVAVPAKYTYVYHLADGGTVGIEYDEEGVLELLNITYPDQNQS